MAKLSLPIERHIGSFAFLRSHQIQILVLSLLAVSSSWSDTTASKNTGGLVAAPGPRLVWKYHTGG